MNTDATTCLYCLRNRKGEHVCPHCGTAADLVHWEYPLLRPGTILQEKYLIGRALGQGGFAITYLALQLNLERRVAIKEYMPSDLAERAEATGDVRPRRDTSSNTDFMVCYERGMKRFIDEGRNIVQCHHPAPHPNIVRVTDYFQTNGTAYLVMDFVEGISLEGHLERQPQNRISEEKAVQIIMPVLDGLRSVHQRGFFHRDVKPANIYLSHDGPVILLDFGSARLQSREEAQTMTVMLTHGYAPPEQYSSKGVQGGWTDVYGCSATLYRSITGADPVSAMDRIAGTVLPRPSEIPGITISPALESVILRGLEPDRAKRPQTIEEFQKALTDSRTGNPPPAQAKTRDVTRLNKPAGASKRIIEALLVLAITIGVILGAVYIYSNVTALQDLDSIKQSAERAADAASPERLKKYAPSEYTQASERLAAARDLESSGSTQEAAEYYREASDLYKNALVVAMQNEERERQTQDVKSERMSAYTGANAARTAADTPAVRQYPPADTLWRSGEASFTAARDQESDQSAINGFFSAKELFEKALKEANAPRPEAKPAPEPAPEPEPEEQPGFAQIEMARSEILEKGIQNLAPEEWETAEDAYQQARRSNNERAITRALELNRVFGEKVRENFANYRRLAPGGAEVIASVLKLRAGPSRDSNDIDDIPRGSRVEILEKPERSIPWVRIRTGNGRTGWAHSAYLVPIGGPAWTMQASQPPVETEDKSARAREAAATERGKALLVEANLFAEGLWEEAELTYARAQSESEYISARSKFAGAGNKAAANKAIYDGLNMGQAKVTSNELNVRTGPSTDGESLQTIEKEHVVMINAKPWAKRPWVEVTVSGRKGWVHSCHLTQKNVPIEEEKEEVMPATVSQAPEPELESTAEQREQHVVTAGGGPTNATAFGRKFLMQESYRELQRIDLSVDATRSDSTFIWYVNGEEVLRGEGQNKLSHYPSPGPLHVKVVLELNGIECASHEGRATVSGMEPIPHSIKVGGVLDFKDSLPGGYGRYTWLVDGKNVSSERILKYKCEAPGTLRVEGKAEQPLMTDGQPYKKALYTVRVEES